MEETLLLRLEKTERPLDAEKPVDGVGVRLRRHRIKILLGDRVEVEMSPYDLTKARIVYRYRAGEARRAQ